MDGRKELERELTNTLEELKGKIDSTLLYLDKHPEDTDYAARLWVSTVKSFMNYGVKKSEERKGDNLFKKVSRMFIFGR